MQPLPNVTVAGLYRPGPFGEICVVSRHRYSVRTRGRKCKRNWYEDLESNEFRRHSKNMVGFEIKGILNWRLK